MIYVPLPGYHEYSVHLACNLVTSLPFLKINKRLYFLGQGRFYRHNCHIIQNTLKIRIESDGHEILHTTKLGAEIEKKIRGLFCSRLFNFFSWISWMCIWKELFLFVIQTEAEAHLTPWNSNCYQAVMTLPAARQSRIKMLELHVTFLQMGFHQSSVDIM